MEGVEEEAFLEEGAGELSRLERLFCENKVLGMGTGKAYMEAGADCKDMRSACAGGGRLMGRERVRAEIRRLMGVKAELEDSRFKGEVMSKIRKRVLCTEIAEGRPIVSDEVLFETFPTHRERLAAIAEDNRLAGDYEPDRQDVSVQGDLFGAALAVIDRGDCGERVE